MSKNLYELKYRYLLYRIQQALLEMEVETRVYRGRRHLENGLYTCERDTSLISNLVSHDEMADIKAWLFRDEVEE